MQPSSGVLPVAPFRRRFASAPSGFPVADAWWHGLREERRRGNAFGSRSTLERLSQGQCAEMAQSSDSVLVAGATGALGRRICTELRRRNGAVRALVRDATGRTASDLAAEGIEIATGDLEDPGSLPAALEGIGTVVSTATAFPRDERPDAIERVDAAGNTALVAAAERAGVERFVFVSFRPIAIDFPLQRAKRAVEERLARSSLDYVSLRPGKFMDIWFSPLCGFDAAGGRATIFGRGVSAVTWIAAADVAVIAARAALGAGPSRDTLELGGPQALSQREAVAVFEDELGRPFALDEIPAPELERRRIEAPNPVLESLAALMLETELGAVTDPAATAPFGLERTSVRAFARGVAAAGV